MRNAEAPPPRVPPAARNLPRAALCCAGVIKHGGVKPNIIPAYTELEYYLRTPSRAELVLLKAKAERCFRSAADATGCQVGCVGRRRRRLLFADRCALSVHCVTATVDLRRLKWSTPRTPLTVS